MKSQNFLNNHGLPDSYLYQLDGKIDLYDNLFQYSIKLMFEIYPKIWLDEYRSPSSTSRPLVLVAPKILLRKYKTRLILE